MSTADSSRARWLAVAPPLSIALLMLGGAMTPSGLDRPITSMSTALSELAGASSQPGRVYLASVLIILGLVTLGVSFVVIGELAGAPGSGIASAAATTGVIGCACGLIVNVLFGIDVAGAAAASTSRGAAARVLVSTGTASGSSVFLLVYLAGILLAGILTGIALWRRGTVPRWIAVGFPIALALGAAAPPGVLNVVLSLPFAGVMVVLAIGIWRDRSVAVDAPSRARAGAATAAPV